MGVIKDQSISGTLKSPHKTSRMLPGIIDIAVFNSVKVGIPEFDPLSDTVCSGNPNLANKSWST